MEGGPGLAFFLEAFDSEPCASQMLPPFLPFHVYCLTVPHSA